MEAALPSALGPWIDPYFVGGAGLMVLMGCLVFVRLMGLRLLTGSPSLGRIAAAVPRGRLRVTGARAPR